MSTCKLLVLVYIHWTDREILAIKKFFAEDPYWRKLNTQNILYP